jgi:hypothetical protein
VSTRSISVVLWIAAFVLTVTLAVFQRMTGPSYPLRGSFSAPGGEVRSYSLPRTHGGPGGLEVGLELPESIPGGTLEWRRYPTGDPWQALALTDDGQGTWSADIPHQPPAGKVEYRFALATGDRTITVPEGDPVVARFRADVPAWVLIPHILAMFGSMLVATRTLLEVFRSSTSAPHALALTAMGLLVVGGLFLGPVVQKFAFDAYWTGWPNGADLTDNKTLIAVIAWLPATILALRRKKLRAAVVVGWVVMMGVFLIPHSLRGSEMDWSEGEIKTGGGVVAVDRNRPA